MLIRLLLNRNWIFPPETITPLTETGYQFIGMDHFACPMTSWLLGSARRGSHRTLHYTTQGDTGFAGDGCFRHQHDWRLLRAKPERVEAYYQQVDEKNDAL